MTVNELINRLQQCSPNLEAEVCYSTDNPLDDSMEIQNLFQITHSANNEDNKVVIQIGG